MLASQQTLTQEVPSHRDMYDGDASDGNSNHDSLPQHIRLFIEEQFLRLLEAPDLSSLQITNVTKLRSAQQQIYLVQFDHRDVQLTTGSINESPLVSNHVTRDPTSSYTSSATTVGRTSVWEDAIRQGNHYVVIKIWTGTSRWWNCHHTETTNTSITTTTDTILPIEGDGRNDTDTPCKVVAKDVSLRQQQRYISKQEIGGYQAAYEAFASIQREIIETGSSSASANSSIVRIPRVLYSSLSDDSTQEDGNIKSSIYRPPWCILEYVGPCSLYFSDHQWIQHDTSYIDSMIPIRMEFGFDEPHLRWGRLPLHLCVPYTLQLLNSFIVPLHVYCFANEHENSSDRIRLPTSSSQTKTYFFDSVIELLKTKISFDIEQNVEAMSDHDVKPTHATILKDASQILNAAIDAICQDEIIQNLPPVLCHMDLQPQNLIIGTSLCAETSNKSCNEVNIPDPQLPSHHPKNYQFLSVLDWEEATYADPRFELLMLCRKVCANREQADYIWQCYNDIMNDRLARYDGNLKIQLGSIAPWLKLESIHNITTMILECVAGGGRGDERIRLLHSNGIISSNNTGCSNSILSKIQREFRRLHSLGFTFCKTDHWCIVEGKDSSTL
jgi:Phosphotransferase enzyme family